MFHTSQNFPFCYVLTFLKINNRALSPLFGIDRLSKLGYYLFDMISTLTIQNFGLIDRLTIEFTDGVNIFTGETGAGKSILIDALNYALGERLNPAQLRNAEKKCVVEVVFELTDEFIKQNSSLSEYITPEDPILIISRIYTPDGRSKNKINGFTVTAGQLKKIGNHLVDLHGPHDHQMLFSETSHIKILDRLSGLKNEFETYTEKYTVWLTLKKELDKLNKLSEHSERELDILGHQIKELERVPINEDAYEALRRESSRINNSEKLYEATGRLLEMLQNEQNSIGGITSQAFTQMNTLNAEDNSTKEFADILSRIQTDCDTLSSLLNSYIDGLSFEPNETDDINSRLDIYQDLLRKYGPSFSVIKNSYTTAKKKYELLIDIEHNDSKLRKKIALAENALNVSGSELSKKREKTAKDLKTTIEKELKELGITKVQFECRIEKISPNEKGCDKVVFYISPNIGESLKPLADIVSSGEAARVMLALKKALTKVDLIPVLIFDEIDAQIGGRLGTITGTKLKELSKDRQIILITHLPQIAAFADRHFVVIKKIENSRTITNVNKLNKDSQIQELAKMMSGEKESQIALKHARDLLKKINN